MNNKQRKTYEAIFKKPVSSAIKWHDLMTMFKGMGATVNEAAGSRVVIEISGLEVVLHKPHPAKEVKPYAIKQLAEFLKQAEARK